MQKVFDGNHSSTRHRLNNWTSEYEQQWRTIVVSEKNDAWNQPYMKIQWVQSGTFKSRSGSQGSGRCGQDSKHLEVTSCRVISSNIPNSLRQLAENGCVRCIHWKSECRKIHQKWMLCIFQPCLTTGGYHIPSDGELWTKNGESMWYIHTPNVIMRKLEF